jgi:hypothetical protein
MRIPLLVVLGALLGAGCAVGETDSALLGTWRYEPGSTPGGCPGLVDPGVVGDRIRLVPGPGAQVVRIQPAGCALAFVLQDGRAEVAPGQVCVRSGVDAKGVAWTETTRPSRWSLVPLAGDRLGETATLEREHARGGVITSDRTTCQGTLVRVARP